ncbi:MAG: hypothetical protein JWM93_562 [Frankiales bacterium]|nr:hypothetical protein [Frankiales bacterium]
MSVRETTSAHPALGAGHDQEKGAPQGPQLSLRRANVVRVGYFVVGVGLAATHWPLFLHHDAWGLAEGTKQCMLLAMSMLALLGLRYPSRMLPILLFEAAWKLLWLGLVALPSLLDGKLDGAIRQQAGEVLWVVIVVAVIPWRHVFTQYVTAAGDPWRAVSGRP